MSGKPVIPLRGRYSSKEMQDFFPADPQHDYRFQCSAEMRSVFSEDAKYLGWRDMWIILAQEQQRLGLSITDEQLTALRATRDTIDHDLARQYERATKHDVMAYLREFKEKADAICPGAGGILHAGATSCEITDNQEVKAMRNGLDILIAKTQRLQSAGDYQGVNVALTELQYRRSALKARGAKGATGTQDSFLTLFNGDHEKVKSLDTAVAQALGFEESYALTGQTYPRIVDYQVLSSLGVLAAALADVLPHDDQTMGALQDIWNKTTQAAQMASQQWLERSLDDSAERRMIISEAFYHIDHLLERALTEEKVEKEIPAQNKLPQLEEALTLVRNKTAATISRMHDFAIKQRDTLCTGYTHGQFAQPATYGKRIDLWNYQLVLALQDLETIDTKTAPSRAWNYLVNSRLTQVAIAAGKTAVDIRLLQHDGEVNEPFANSQVGSSAMAYKKNPMKAERINGLARHKIGSTIPGTLRDYDLLCTDAMLNLMLAIFVEDTQDQTGFTVHALAARRNLVRYMPFLASEEILMHALAQGGDRQTLHEQMRVALQTARTNFDRGEDDRALDLLLDAGFPIDTSRVAMYLDPETHVGRAREQVDEFEQKMIHPIRERYKDALQLTSDVRV